MKRWDEWLHRVRWAVLGLQVPHALLVAVADVSSPAGCLAALRQLLLAGTASEVAVRLGTMWLLRPSRRLPLWPVLPVLAPVSRWAFRLRWPNQLLAGLFLAGLAGGNWLGLGGAVGCMWLLCLLDGWRLVYTHYWLAGLTALLLPDAPGNLLLMLAGLYLWSGLAKLFSPSFHAQVAPAVFAPLNAALGALLPDPTHHRTACRWLSGVGVGLEAVLGLLLVVVWSGRAASWVKLCAGVFSTGMHLYIIVYLGLVGNLPPGRRRVFIIGWNTMCCSLVHVLLRADLSAHGECLAGTALMALVMLVLPAAMLFGPVGDGCLAHAYFAPGWFGLATLVVPASSAGAVREVGGELYDAAELLALPSVRTAVESAGCMKGQWLMMDGQIVDDTHRLGKLGDPEWNNFYNTGIRSFWQMIVDELIKAPCVLVERRNWSLTKGCHDAATLLRPTATILNVGRFRTTWNYP